MYRTWRPFLGWNERRALGVVAEDRKAGWAATPPTIYLVLGADTAGVGRVPGQLLMAPCAHNAASTLSARVIPVYYPLMGVHGIGLAAARDGRG